MLAGLSIAAFNEHLAYEQKVREVSAAYSLPKRLVSQLGPLQTLQLSLSARNLLTFTGYTGRTIFTLENGQRWAQSQRDSAYFPKIDSPPVIIMKAGFGYRMYIAGGGAIRVSKIQ